MIVVHTLVAKSRFNMMGLLKVLKKTFDMLKMKVISTVLRFPCRQ